jgi:hypothetical protein
MISFFNRGGRVFTIYGEKYCGNVIEVGIAARSNPEDMRTITASQDRTRAGITGRHVDCFSKK